MDSLPKGRWVFERANPMGGARATAWRDPLEGSALPSEARIARETIQNSVDATLPTQRTELFVWDKALSGVDMEEFASILGLDSPNSPTERIARLGLKDGNSFERMKTGESEIRVTIIEDRNTCGLGFDESDGKDRFRELCLYLGQESTAVDSSRGGSYGFGKTVYQASSDCRTFLVYSVFKPKPETGGSHARLFGCSLFNGHSIEGGAECTGRAWFGLPATTESGQEKCDPLTDEAAHDMAQRLGFMKRDANDLGTSIMIVGSEIDMDKFREAVEDYWWPRIVSDQLSVELWEGNDGVLPPPEPLLRSHLRPYIRCYELVEYDAVPEEGERRPRINARQGVRIGALGLKALASNDLEDQDDPTRDTHFNNTVALVRSGPRMVVQYMDTGGRMRNNFAGTFVSHPDSEAALHLSEPPSHSAWSPNSERLRSANPGYQQLVSSILNTIKQQTRRFQRELNPAHPSPAVAGTRKLGEILAGMMSAKGLGPRRPPGSTEDPFEMRIHEGRTNTEKESKVTARLSIRLRGDAAMDSATALVSFRPTVVLDDNRRRDSSERLGLSHVSVDDAEVSFDDDSEVFIHISKSSTVTVAAESECFDRDLYADLEVSVRIPDAPEDQPSLEKI